MPKYEVTSQSAGVIDAIILAFAGLGEGYALNLKGVCDRANRGGEVTLGVIWHMKDLGLLVACRDLMDEDGMAAGSGWELTDAGRARLAELEGAA